MAFIVNNYDIAVDRFDYGVDMVWDLKNPDDTDFNLDDYDVQFIVKAAKYEEDSQAIFNTIINGSESSVSVPLMESLTSNPAGTYYYALRLIRDGQFVDTILQAQFIIRGNTFAEGVNG